MRILVTGASGFIGSQFINRYRDKYEIHALIRKNSVLKIDLPHIHYYDGTLNSIKKAMFNIDIVIHLATYYIAEHREDDIEKLLQANVNYGAQLLESMKQLGVKRIVNIGTTWQKFGGQEYRYANLYAATKQVFQELLSYYADAYQWRAINLHLNDTYGKDDHRKKIIQLLLEAAETGEVLNMSPGEQRFETCHIDDVLNALNIALGRLTVGISPSNEEFSILTGDDISLRELVKLVEKITGKSIHINWGGRPYREREVMFTPFSSYRKLPGWEKLIPLEKGVEKLK